LVFRETNCKRRGWLLDFLGKEVPFVEEENHGCFSEPLVVADIAKEFQ
jgi:hypothetical protein